VSKQHNAVPPPETPRSSVLAQREEIAKEAERRAEVLDQREPTSAGRLREFATWIRGKS
jgi:hypothetical protein